MNCLHCLSIVTEKSYLEVSSKTCNLPGLSPFAQPSRLSEVPTEPHLPLFRFPSMSPSFDVPSLINEFTLAQAHAFKLTRVLSNGSSFPPPPSHSYPNRPSPSPLAYSCSHVYVDPLTRTIFLLGTLPLPSQDGEGERKAAIVKMEKTSFDVLAFSQEGSMDAGEVLVKGLEKVDGMGGNDIYAWATGWFGEGRGADVKMMVSIVCLLPRLLCPRPYEQS
jgi:hypothetical protein